MKQEEMKSAVAFKFARKLLGLSQRDFAKKLSINQATVSKIERGLNAPHDDTISNLEKLTDMSYKELVEKGSAATAKGGAKGKAGDELPAKDEKQFRHIYHQTAVNNLQKKIRHTNKQLEIMKERRRTQVSLEKIAAEDTKKAKKLRLHLQKSNGDKALIKDAMEKEEQLKQRLENLRDKGVLYPVANEILRVKLKIEELEVLSSYHEKMARQTKPG